MPPNLTTIARMPSSVPRTVSGPFNQLAEIFQSVMRQLEVVRTDANEWTLGGAGGGGEGATRVYFPHEVTSEFASLVEANRFSAPQVFYGSIEGGQTFTALTVQSMFESVGDVTTVMFTVLGAAGSSVFGVTAAGTVTASGNVNASGNADFAGTLAVGTADAFTVAATGAVVGLSISLASAAFTVSSTGLLDVNIGPAEFRPGANGNVVARFLQHSGSQTGNMWEVTDSTGATVLSFLDPSGGIGLSSNSVMIYNRAFSWNSTLTFNANCAFTGTTSDVVDFSSRGVTVTQQSSSFTALAIRPFFAAAGNTFVYPAIRSHPQIVGTPAAGFGQRWSFAAQSSTTNDRDVGAILGRWAVATDASRTGSLQFTVFSTTTEQEGIRVTAFSTGCVVTIGNDANYDGLVVNENGEDADARMEGDTEPNLFFLDASADRIGIGTNTPAARLHVLAVAAAEGLRVETPATNDDPNYYTRQARVATTDATQTTLDTFTITASKTYLIEARVLARRTGGAAGTADDGAAYIRRAMVTTKAGTVTINAVQDGLTQEDQAGWDCTLDVNAATVRVRVTGAADNNVVWHSTTTLQDVGT